MPCTCAGQRSSRRRSRGHGPCRGDGARLLGEPRPQAVRLAEHALRLTPQGSAARSEWFARPRRGRRGGRRRAARAALPCERVSTAIATGCQRSHDAHAPTFQARSLTIDAPVAHPTRQRVPELAEARPGRSVETNRCSLPRGAGLCGLESHDAEDLVRDVPRRAQGLRPTAPNELAYLFRALRHTYVNHLRAARTGPPPVSCSKTPRPRPPRIALTRGNMDAIASAPAQYRDAVIAVDLCF